jgi:hypothetical protein
MAWAAVNWRRATRMISCQRILHTRVQSWPGSRQTALPAVFQSCEGVSEYVQARRTKRQTLKWWAGRVHLAETYSISSRRTESTQWHTATQRVDIRGLTLRCGRVLLTSSSSSVTFSSAACLSAREMRRNLRWRVGVPNNIFVKVVAKICPALGLD